MKTRMPAHIAGASATLRLRKLPLDYSRRPVRPSPELGRAGEL
jgi:hypothetical protein